MTKPARARETPEPARWQRLDALLLAALLLLCVLWSIDKLQWSATPMEDASMLLRYAQNLAAGHGIRWSLNQVPVDGATDFLFMAAIAGLARLAHLDVVTASRWLNLAAQGCTVGLLFTAARRILDGNRWLAAAMAVYVIGGPALTYTNACFGAPFFAFFLLACWCAGLAFLARPSWPLALLTASLGLLAGLTRPEGVLIAALLMAAILYLLREIPPAHRRPAAIRLVASFAAIFGGLGGAYFAWRWRYFGYPLPNPFYVKGDGHLYLGSLGHAAMNLVVLLLPVLWTIPLGWLLPATRRLTTALCGLLLAFTALWVLLTNANNHFSRFQYAVVPIVLVTLPALLTPLLLRRPFGRALPPESALPPVLALPPGATPLRRAVPSLAALLALCATLLYLNHTYFYVASAGGMRSFALRLAPLASRGYTMAVTEAGALPLYSRWNTIDGLGLNDAFLAHHHLQATDAYLDRFHPEVIMVHLDRSFPEQFSGVLHGAPPVPDAGLYPQEFLSHYATTHGYTLAAAWGANPCNLHLYWLRPGFADYATVLLDLRRGPYVFLDNGLLSHDYRDELDSLQVCATE